MSPTLSGEPSTAAPPRVMHHQETEAQRGERFIHEPLGMQGRAKEGLGHTAGLGHFMESPLPLPPSSLAVETSRLHGPALW